MNKAIAFVFAIPATVLLMWALMWCLSWVMLGPVVFTIAVAEEIGLIKAFFLVNVVPVIFLYLALSNKIEWFYLKGITQEYIMISAIAQTIIGMIIHMVLNGELSL